MPEPKTQDNISPSTTKKTLTKKMHQAFHYIEDSTLFSEHLVTNVKFIPVIGAILSAIAASLRLITLIGTAYELKNELKQGEKIDMRKFRNHIFSLTRTISILILGITLCTALFMPGAAIHAAAIIIITAAAVSAFFGLLTNAAAIYKETTKQSLSGDVSDNMLKNRKSRFISSHLFKIVSTILLLFINLKIGLELMGYANALGGEEAMIGLAIAGICLLACSMFLKSRVGMPKLAKIAQDSEDDDSVPAQKLPHKQKENIEQTAKDDDKIISRYRDDEGGETDTGEDDTEKDDDRDDGTRKKTM